VKTSNPTKEYKTAKPGRPCSWECYEKNWNILLFRNIFFLKILINVKAGRVNSGARKVYHRRRVGQTCVNATFYNTYSYLFHFWRVGKTYYKWNGHVYKNFNVLVQVQRTGEKKWQKNNMIHVPVWNTQRSSTENILNGSVNRWHFKRGRCNGPIWTNMKFD
jgi:hypothetical protein